MIRYLSIFLIILCTSCTAKNSTENKKLKIAVPVEPVSLTPYTSNDVPSYRVRWQIFDQLIKADKGGKLIPMLAVSWTNISPTTIQLSLRSNVYFHDGKEFTAEDAKFSIESAVASSDLFGVIGVIKDADVVDRYTINVNTHTTYAPKEVILSHPGILMTSKSAMKSNLIIGTGAFKLKSWDRGQSVTLVKNEKYWGDAPYFDEVKFLVVPEPSVRSIIVETGEADIAYDIDGSDRKRLMDNKSLVYLEGVAPTIHYLGFNLTKPLYQNKKFRQAVAMAIDYQGIVDNVAFGVGSPATSLLQKDILGADSNLPLRKKNIEAAKKLLSEINIPSGTTLNIYTIEGIRKKMAEIIQANLTQLGLNAKITILEYGTLLEYAQKGNLDLFLAGWTTIPSDADIGLNSLILSSNKWIGGNYSAYNNPQVDALLIAGRSETNLQKRIQIYHQIQEILYDEVPLIPLFHPHNNALIKKDIQGFKINYFSIHDIKTVKK